MKALITIFYLLIRPAFLWLTQNKKNRTKRLFLTAFLSSLTIFSCYWLAEYFFIQNYKQSRYISYQDEIPLPIDKFPTRPSDILFYSELITSLAFWSILRQIPQKFPKLMEFGLDVTRAVFMFVVADTILISVWVPLMEQRRELSLKAWCREAQIKYALEEYFIREKRYPENLQPIVAGEQIVDPLTKASYIFEVYREGKSFRLKRKGQDKPIIDSFIAYPGHDLLIKHRPEFLLRSLEGELEIKCRFAKIHNR